ncbi:DUF1848 domain-containing protein [Calditrichota bacterium GD2]
MKDIISASRRTDIPAFYLNWFIQRIREGFVEVQNPFYPQAVKRVLLDPEHVEWIVFWSRNYSHFLKKRAVFEAYQLFFHFTILSPSVLEKSSMPIERQLRQLEELVKFYGAERIVWRYDPLVFWQEGNTVQTNFNGREFEFLAREISQLGLKSCTISVATPYAKFQRRLRQKFPNVRLLDPSAAFVKSTVSSVVEIAEKHQIKIEACCSDFLLKIIGVHKAACINGHYLNRLTGKKKVSEARAPSRAQCACTRSIDIGDYRRQPCYFGCIYCYANPLWK